MTELSEKDFFKELEELNVKLRADIEAKKLGIDNSEEAIAERRSRVLNGDFKFFCYTYFPHHIFGEPSKFQKHFFKTFPELLFQSEGCKEWWVAPRGEAKSTLSTKLGSLYVCVIALLQKELVREEVAWKGEAPVFLDYVTILGAETKLPTKLLEVVKTELTANANLAMDFPEVVGKTTQWKIGEFTSNTGVKYESFGAEQAIRGTFHGSSRPKLLMPDDLITEAEAKSPTERNNRWNWLEAAVNYLGPPDGSVKFIGVGTILNDDDPISRAKRTPGHTVHHFKAIEKLPDRMDMWAEYERLMRNDDVRIKNQRTAQGKRTQQKHLPSYKYYVANKKSMDKGAVTSWPTVRSLLWLMTQRATNPRSFGTEMQGEARNDEDKVFVDLQFFVSILHHWLPYGACDPSLGKGETSDPSAILAGYWCREKRALHVDYAEIKRRVPSKIFSDIIKVHKDYGCGAWGFENNNAYEYMRTEFIDKAAVDGLHLSLFPHTTKLPPEVRIDSLEPVVSGIDAKIFFKAGLISLLSELDTWPEAQTHHHYDGLTALYILYVTAMARAAGAPRIATRKSRR